MLKRLLSTLAVASAIGLASSAAWSEPKDIRWGTGPVGSVGHKALVVLADFAASGHAAHRLAAQTFLVCYSAAAIAPVLIGALRDATGSYAPAFALLAAAACGELAIATRLRPALRGSVQ